MDEQYCTTMYYTSNALNSEKENCVVLALDFQLDKHDMKTGGRVEKSFKGSQDSIPLPSPSVRIQIMGGKVRLRCKGKTLLGIVKKLLKQKVC